MRSHGLTVLHCLVGAFALTSAPAWSGDGCAGRVFKDFAGANFLHSKFPTLHTQDLVMRGAGPSAKSLKPGEKISAWLEKLEERLKDPAFIAKLRRRYHDEYLIRADEIPEGYYELQRRIARERGYGNVSVTPEFRKQEAEILIRDQQNSLDEWFDYLITEDSRLPLWAKYWSFSEMLKLGKFNAETGVFANRSKGYVGMFAELNREALAEVATAVMGKAHGTELENTDEQLKKLLEGAIFGKMYGHALQKATRASESLEITKGKWVKYSKGSHPKKLVKSICSKGTGWCTAGSETANVQLQGGDFYVYYSQDKTGKAVNPRIAIRMEGDRIEEVRGIGKNQNLDGHIANSGILDEKLKEFGDEGQKYMRRSHDMSLVTELEAKTSRGDSFTQEELRFIYETENKIEGFGYQDDPRIREILRARNPSRDILDMGFAKHEISPDELFSSRGLARVYISVRESYSRPFFFSKKLRHDLRLLWEIEEKNRSSEELSIQELRLLYGLDEPVAGFERWSGERPRNIRSSRNKKKDLARAFETTENKVALTVEEVNRGEAEIYYESFTGRNYSVPKEVSRDMKLLTDLEAKVHGGKKLTKKELSFLYETDAKIQQFKDPNTNQHPPDPRIYKILSSRNSKADLAYVLGIPESKISTTYEEMRKGGFDVHYGDVSVPNFVSDTIPFPKTFIGNLLIYADSPQRVGYPEKITGNLQFMNWSSGKFSSLDSLVLPKHVAGDLTAPLRKIKNIRLPEKVDGHVSLGDLYDVEGSLVLPKEVGGDLRIPHLRSPEGVKFPDKLEGDLDASDEVYDFLGYE